MTNTGKIAEIEDSFSGGYTPGYKIPVTAEPRKPAVDVQVRLTDGTRLFYNDIMDELDEARREYEQFIQRAREHRERLRELKRDMRGDK